MQANWLATCEVIKDFQIFDDLIFCNFHSVFHNLLFDGFHQCKQKSKDGGGGALCAQMDFTRTFETTTICVFISYFLQIL